jgi:DNA-binding NarL/FixJ family response regulator
MEVAGTARRILGPVLVVQERRRLYREALTAYLRRQLATTEVLPGVADADELLAVASGSPVAHAVIEADPVPWDVPALAASLRAARPDIKVIALAVSGRHGWAEGVTLLPRGATPDQVVQLVEPHTARDPPFVLSLPAVNGTGPLTEQQLRVLALLSLGLTVAGVAARLGLSERAVSKSKTAIFAKLGVQSQAQAVATALANGLLGPSPGVAS